MMWLTSRGPKLPLPDREIQILFFSQVEIQISLSLLTAQKEDARQGSARDLGRDKIGSAAFSGCQV